MSNWVRGLFRDIYGLRLRVDRVSGLGIMENQMEKDNGQLG